MRPRRCATSPASAGSTALGVVALGARLAWVAPTAYAFAGAAVGPRTEAWLTPLTWPVQAGDTGLAFAAALALTGAALHARTAPRASAPRGVVPNDPHTAASSGPCSASQPRCSALRASRRSAPSGREAHAHAARVPRVALAHDRPAARRGRPARRRCGGAAAACRPARSGSGHPDRPVRAHRERELDLRGRHPVLARALLGPGEVAADAGAQRGEPRVAGVVDGGAAGVCGVRGAIAGIPASLARRGAARAGPVGRGQAPAPAGTGGASRSCHHSAGDPRGERAEGLPGSVVAARRGRRSRAAWR